MCLLSPDQPHLSRALDLARTSAAFASPNPAVGCVITGPDGEALGEGSHHYTARDHAEVVALKAAAMEGKSTAGATAYVTLEPCSYHGRTGPCAEALIAAGIVRCVVATVDPNPLVRGKGLEKLRRAGVEVCVADPCAPEAQTARRLNDAFAFSIQHGRPFVTLKAAVSQNGKLAPPPQFRSSTEPFWLTGEAARADVQRLRHESDAVLTGIGTVLADDPLLTDRTGEPRRRPLLRVVLDPGLRIPLHSRLVRSAREGLLVIAGPQPDTQRVDALQQCGAEVVRVAADGRRLSLHEVLATLERQAVRSVLLEAGSSLNASFLEADLVDRVVLYRSPTQLHDASIPLAYGVDVPGFLTKLQQVATAAFPHGASEDERISGYLHDPWARVSAPLQPEETLVHPPV